MAGCIDVGEALPQKHASSATHDTGGIDRVHVVWMNHLDVGFTNNIASVLNIYFHEYFTKAIETAKEVNTPGEPLCSDTPATPGCWTSFSTAPNSSVWSARRKEQIGMEISG